MKPIEFFVKNYQFTLVLFFGVLSLGAFSLFNMPRGEDPDFEAPNFAVVAIYPGASPTDMEQLVVDPIERSVSALNNIKRIRTDITDGLAVFRVDFEYNSNPDEKYQELIREINALRSDLPPDLYKLDINRFTPSDVNIFQFALVSEHAPYQRMEHWAEELKAKLEKNKDLKKVQIHGLPEQKVQVYLDLARLGQQRIPVNRVLGALQSSNVNLPGGSIHVGGRKLNLKTTGTYATLEEIGATAVQVTGAQVTYLRDVAEVVLEPETETYLTRYNGRRAVFVTAALKPGKNITAVRASVLAETDAYKASLPGQVDMVTAFDQGESVNRRLNRFVKDFAIAIFLVLITLLPLGGRASLVVMISIPLSLAIGLSLMNLLGYTINQLSVVGLIVALGILVDDSIVVVENIERYLREGRSRKDAAIQATQQIALAVAGCTATLIFAFLPLVFLPEASGDFIRSLPVAVITSVLASLLVSLMIVPFLSSRLLREHVHPEGNIFLRALKRLIGGTYSRALDWALRRPGWTLGITAAIFAGALSLIPAVGFSLFPASDKPMFLVNIDTPAGTNLYETDRIVRQVEDTLRQTAGIRNFSANVGKGNPRIYYNVFQKNESENFGQIFVQTLGEDLEAKQAIIASLRSRLAGIPNAVVTVKDFEQGPPVDAPLAYRILGDNLDTLRAVAFRVERLVAETEGAIYVDNPVRTRPTDLQVKVNKDKAALAGVATLDVDRMVRLGIAGLEIGSFRQPNGEEVPIRVAVRRQGPAATYETLDRLFVNAYSGAALPIMQVAQVELESTPNEVRHFDKQRFVTVSALVDAGYNTARLHEEIMQKIDQLPLPNGYQIAVAGEAESRQESLGGLEAIILITAFGFIGILLLEFRTFKSLLIVLSVIPLGIIGALLMLWLTGETLSFTATIGFIALVGIEVKNSILLVDYTNQLRAQGMELEEAIRVAGEVRFVPILLTSLTAIGGFSALVIEYSPLYSPLALVLIGGLISSTFLSRLVTPVMYKLLPPSLEA